MLGRELGCTRARFIAYFYIDFKKEKRFKEISRLSRLNTFSEYCFRRTYTGVKNKQKDEVMEFMIGMILFAVAILIIVIDSLVNFGLLEGIHFGRNSFRKEKEPLYNDDRTINRHYGK